MECERTVELLLAVQGGDLSAGEKAAVEAHLRSCPACAALAARLAETDAALASFPAIEPDPALLARLAAIAAEKPHFSLFAVLRRPRLQPVLAAAGALGILVSFYLLNPNRRDLDKSIVRAFHRGLGRIETLYQRAAGGPEAIGDYAQNIYASIQAIKPPPDRNNKS